jgi:hypothetical protein
VSTALATEATHSTQLFESSGSTLEDSILGAWEDLTSFGRTECPVCAGELEAGGCKSCGSELS